MKPNFKLRSFLAGSLFLALIGAVQAQTQYYYDNVAGAGFGSAGNTWGTNSVISTDSTGTAAAANTATTTLDTLNLGSSTAGLGAGTITVVAGGRSIGSIVRGTASNSGIITLSGGPITFGATGSVTNNGGASASTIISSVIAGAATSMTFTTDGTGSNWQVDALNTYAGATIISAGSQLRVSGNLNDGGTASALGSSSSAASNLILENAAQLWYTGGVDSTNRNFTMNGAAATLQFRGSGLVTWSGTASYGGTADEAKTLTFATSSTATAGGTFSGVLTDNGSGQLSLVKSGSSSVAANHLTLNSANTFTGSTTITGGILSLGNANALQNSYINTTASATGTTTTGLRTTGNALNLGGLSGNKDLSTIYTSSTGGYSSVTGITLNTAFANNLTYSGLIDGARSVSKTGLGTQVLTSASNAYTLGTTVSNGTLGFASGALGTTGNITVNGGTLRWESGNTQDISARVVMQNSGSAAFNTNSNDVTFANAIGSSSSSSFTKSGAGTLTLSATNTYSGSTTISAGTLALGAAGSIANTSGIYLTGAAAKLNVTAANFTLGATQTLGGIGTVENTGRVLTASGTLAPGNSPGTLTVDGGTVALVDGGDYSFEILNASAAAGTGYDTTTLINGGVLDLSALSASDYTINLLSLSSIGPDVSGNAIFDNTQNYSWTLFSTNSSLLTDFDANDFFINPAGFTNALGGGAFSVGLADGNTDIVLNFAAIPEPKAALLGCVGLLLLLRRRR